jgi:hypothetical protein
VGSAVVADHFDPGTLDIEQQHALGAEDPDVDLVAA